MKKIGVIIILIAVVLFLLFSLWSAIPASADSPKAPDDDPTDNYAEVWCPNDCTVTIGYDAAGPTYDIKCVYNKRETASIKGSPGSTCWCKCIEDTDGLLIPYCSCYEFAR